MQQSLQKILYVEDDPDIQAVASMVLELDGFEVVACSSGREALAEIQRSKPDFLLLDVMMPDLDGPQTLREIRRLNLLQNIPFAFMTAKVQSNEISELHTLGACGVIAKPFDPMTLAAQIRELWQQAVNSNV